MLNPTPHIDSDIMRSIDIAKNDHKDFSAGQKMARWVKKMNASSAPIWKSRLSWRIALVVFVTILLIQVTILVLTLRQEEAKLMNDMREQAVITLSTLLIDAPPLPSRGEVNAALNQSPVKGFTLYSRQLDLVGGYGNDAVTNLSNGITTDIAEPRNGVTEIVLTPGDIGRYYAVAVTDTRHVGPALNNFILQNMLVMLLLSAFVTTVLMIALGKWLLEPILFMCQNLLAAQRNPDRPQIRDNPFSLRDEIGEAIEISQRLIEKNAENLSQIRTAAEDKIHKLAYFDQLTGLPNRTCFIQKLTEKAFAGDEGAADKLAIVTLDLDHFKDINDSMGHNVGDAILRGVAKRLRMLLPNHAVVARAGEDEFAIMVPLNPDMPTAEIVARQIAAIIREEPFKVYNENFQVRSSIGVATFPDDGNDPNTVLKNADIALNRAKEDGRDRITEYSEDFDRAVQMRFQMLRDLRDALENEDLTVFYQPQFDLRSGAIIGAEALIRWWKKDNSANGGGFISPAEFIPIAEQSGLIVPIGKWVMKEACRTAASWHAQGQSIRIAVNVSGAQFYQSDLVAYTKQCLNETGVRSELLELEVTESIFMDDIKIAIDTLRALHELGVELAIDDFGTGYSSLSYLRQFKIDRLKIDQSFIRNALVNDDDAAIARTIISLGHSLNLKIIAEGVETGEHERFLLAEGCDEVQGFRYSKPVPKEEFWRFVSGYGGSLSAF